jgi:hypothetical protein
VMFVLGALGIRHAHKVESATVAAPTVERIPATV